MYWQTADDSYQEKCSVVHALISGQDDNRNQCIRFKDRTQLFWDRLEDGDFSLLLLNVSQSDGHTYRCVVLETIDHTKVIHEAKVVLSLAGKNLCHLPHSPDSHFCFSNSCYFSIIFKHIFNF